jgi:hypothetical protein
MNSNNLQDIFENLQGGTVLAFYKSGIIGSIIPFFTREKKGERVPHHVATAYEVEKSLSVYNGRAFCTFKLSEQGFHGGKYRTVEIIKYDDIFYTTDEYFLKQDFIKQCFTGMTPEEENLGIQDAIRQVGKKYGYSRFILTAEIFEKILPKSFQRKIFAKLNKKQGERLCSSHVVFNLNSTGKYDIPTDQAYSPNEVIKLKDVFTNV